MLSVFSYNFISNIVNLKNFCIFVISNKSFISQNLKVVAPLGGKFDFFRPSGFEIQKIKFHSVRALKCSLNEKNILGRVTVDMFLKRTFDNCFEIFKLVLPSRFDFSWKCE